MRPLPDARRSANPPRGRATRAPIEESEAPDRGLETGSAAADPSAAGSMSSMSCRNVSGKARHRVESDRHDDPPSGIAPFGSILILLKGVCQWLPALTSTSYAILGLLALKPWTTYELAQQMDRALGRFWPRAESRIYEEPKKLVARGLARASSEMVGKRPRTVYTITAKGRRALAEWVADPGFRSRARVRTADQGVLCRTRDQSAICSPRSPAVREWSDERLGASARVPQAYLDGNGPFSRAPPVASSSSASSSSTSISWLSAGPSGRAGSSMHGPTTSPRPSLIGRHSRLRQPSPQHAGEWAEMNPDH